MLNVEIVLLTMGSVRLILNIVNCIAASKQIQKQIVPVYDTKIKSKFSNLLEFLDQRQV